MRHICNSAGMNLRERFRRFWGPRPVAEDHPLSEEERNEHHPDSAYDELARDAGRFLGDDLDPDEHRRD